MATYLVDTNILLRIRHNAAPEYLVIRGALRQLLIQGDTLCFTSQNLVEFWNVSTRPATARGGLGLTIERDQPPSAANRAPLRFPSGLAPGPPRVAAPGRRPFRDGSIST